MKKRSILSLALAVLMSALVVGQTFAATEASVGENRRLYGEVVAVGEDSLTIRTPTGEEQTFLVDGATRFRSKEGELSGLDAIQVGMKVFVLPADSDVARIVLVLPDDFDPGRWSKGSGTVVSVDAAAGSLTLATDGGGEISLLVDENTRFVGGIAGLEALETGLRIGYAAREDENGNLVAGVLAARPQEKVRPARGTVMTVSLENGTFTLQTVSGEEKIYQVNENTRFRSKDGSLAGLADLQVGMVAIVVAADAGGETATAQVIAAGNPEDMPSFDQRARGQVTSVNDRSFTLVTAQEETFTFVVDESTRFLSASGAVQGLADLQSGDRVVVGAQEGDGGELIARLVAVNPSNP
ncbi:MAG: hypothetical protein D6803_08040 [Anaerolineae bacterium]|nr:MAG: hypothetical protein D6803_08040 [Anaerolineae bacterium]